jgi:tRNA uridine 5-carbamoylmethylation protein Kti12
MGCDERSDDGTTATVILLCGLPGSGKSHLARKLRERMDDDADDDGDDNVHDRRHAELQASLCRPRRCRRRLIHIEYDDIEDALMSSGTDCDGEDDQRREAWNAARQLAVSRLHDEMESIAAIHARGIDDKRSSDATARGSSIILMDDNFHLRGMRKRIHRLLLRHKDFVHFGILWMDTPLDACIHRNRQRERAVPEPVIIKMNEQLEPPRAAWEINSWMLITETVSLEEIVEFILGCPKIVDLPDEPDLERQAVDRAKTLASKSHTADKLLRSWVGQVAKFDTSLVGNANEARKELMRNLKSGDLDFTDDHDGLKEAFLDLVLPSNELRTKLRDSLLA